MNEGDISTDVDGLVSSLLSILFIPAFISTLGYIFFNIWENKFCFIIKRKIIWLAALWLFGKALTRGGLEFQFQQSDSLLELDPGVFLLHPLFGFYKEARGLQGGNFQSL